MNIFTGLGNRIAERTNTIAGFGNIVSDRIAEATRLGNSLAQGSNAKSAEANVKLERITSATQATARKDMSVNVTVNTTLQVSAREVAHSIKHIDFIQGHSDRI